MKTKAKKLLSVLLAFTMLFSLLAGFDFTAKAAVSDDFCLYYDFIDSRLDDVAIVGYEGAIDYLEIPEYVEDGYKVVSIDFAAFRDMDSLKGVIIPNTVTSISGDAFNSCSNLEYVVLSDNLGEIGPGAFRYCRSLYRVVSQSSDYLPEKLWWVAGGAFSHCDNLINLHFVSGPELGSGVFYGSDSLRSIVFERSFYTAWKDTFEALPDLTTVWFYGTKEQWEDCFNQNVWDENVIYNCTKCASDDEHESNWVHAGNSFFMCCEKCGEITYELSFKDLSEYREHYFKYVLYTSAYNEFIKGTNPPFYSQFSPKTSLTRAMFVAILYRMAGNPYDHNNPHKTNPFTDIQPGAYYYNAACWALDEGITNQTTFKPNDNVTREQTARFLFAYAEANDMIGNEEYLNTDISDYPDYDSVHRWAVEPLQWANYNDMITGTLEGYINPQGATQRIHATRILYGFGCLCNIGNLI